MPTTILEVKLLRPALRALQVIFAIIVMGTDGYAINVYRGCNSIVHTPVGSHIVYVGVPDAWGFLVFCACWTVLVVIFQFVAGNTISDRTLIEYFRVAVEVVAMLSWFAGWIAVAVNIGTGACKGGWVSQGALKAATVFGALEWLLFTSTAYWTALGVLNSRRMSATTAP